MNKVIPIFIIGAQKAGTSYLFSLLSKDIRIAKGEVKEPQIYSKPCNEVKDFYSFFMIDDQHQFVLDASATYLHVEGTAESILKRFGRVEPFIFVVIRDPVERAISGYLHEVKHGREIRLPNEVFGYSADSLEELVDQEAEKIERDWKSGRVQPHYSPSKRYRNNLFQFKYLANSAYSIQLKPWVNSFSNLYLIDFNTLSNQPLDILNKVRKIIGFDAIKDIPTDVIKNKTVISSTKSIKKNIALKYDYGHSSKLNNAYCVWKLVRSIKKSKPSMTENEVKLLYSSMDYIIRNYCNKWIDLS